VFLDFTEGVWSFFHEPAKGIMVSPRDFGIGLAKGTVSLVSKTVQGAFGTATKIVGAIKNVAVVMTVNNEFKRENAKVQAPVCSILSIPKFFLIFENFLPIFFSHFILPMG
jgi:hypothetical protein